MDSKLWTVCFVTVSVCCFLVIGLSDEQRSAAWLQSISLMNQHKSPSKSFPTVSSFPISPHLPSLTERPEAKHRGNGAAKHIAHGFGFGDNRSRDPCRALQLLQGSTTTHTYTHTYTLPTQHIPRAYGESTQCPPWENWGDRDCNSSELYSPFSPPLLLLLSLQATLCTCYTTDSLMLHYPYTSLSVSALLKAMFTDVASKVGHEHNTQRHMKRMEMV